MEKRKTVPLYLAPMAGAGDRAFRESCAVYGVDFFCTEMISAKAVHFGDKKTEELAAVGEGERPIALQLFGSDPAILSEAAEKFGNRPEYARIDLNFGCPVPKIVNNGEGSALMRDPKTAEEIVRQVVKASPIPVSVKIRAGWDETCVSAVELARRCEDAGASVIAVHGRLRSDFYRDGTVRYQVIRAVKEAVSIPVIGNGDVRDGASAKKMLEETGCDGLMIGRAAVGSPWVFAGIRAALEGKEPPVISKKEAVLHHLQLAFRYKPKTAAREMRMHMTHYLKGFRGAAALRDRAARGEKLEDYLAVLDEICEEK